MKKEKDNKLKANETAFEASSTNDIKMSKKEFAIRMVLFTIFGLVLPFGFVVYRYGLFKDTHTTLTGIGLFAVIIAFVFIKHVLNMYKKANEHTMTAQIISGYSKVIIPLLILLYFVVKMSGDIETFIQSLECVIVCELIAIPIDPLPVWAYQRNIEITGISLKKTWDKIGKSL